MDLNLVNDSPIHPCANTIEYLNGNKAAILFIHGFPSSPAEHLLAVNLAKSFPFDLLSPRIPTFASDYNLFLKTTFNDWYEFIKSYYITWRKKYSRFFIVGTSMGGAITLKLASEFSNDNKLRPTAITTIAAPVFLNRFPSLTFRQPFAFCLPLIGIFTKAVKPVLRYPTKEKRDGVENWCGYNGIFVKPTISFFKALKIIKKNLANVSVPAMLIHHKGDKTVPFANLFYIASKISSHQVECHILQDMSLTENRHCLLIYKSVSQKLLNKIITFFNTLEE